MAVETVPGIGHRYRDNVSGGPSGATATPFGLIGAQKIDRIRPRCNVALADTYRRAVLGGNAGVAEHCQLLVISGNPHAPEFSVWWYAGASTCR